MDRGWTRSWRREMDSAVWRQPPMYYRFWKWLHANAAHAGTAEAMDLKPGTLLTSYSAIAKGLEYGDVANPIQPSDATITAMLAWMQKEKMIKRRAGYRRRTIIVICNWARYQPEDSEASPVTPVPPKEKKKRRKPPAPYVPSEHAVRCLKQWEKGRPLPTNPDGTLMLTREEYQKVFDMLHTSEKLTWLQIGTIVVHATTVWEREYIQSPEKLRKKGSKRSTYPGQYYWQTIWTASQQANDKGAGNGGTWTPPEETPPRITE